MQVLITLTDKEIKFLEKMILEISSYKKEQYSIEDATHECIRMAMYDESEEAV